jgi:DNA mismatch endonuclease (patch repair protein)
MKKKKQPMTRSENMRRIKSENTSIEKVLRKALWHKGVRYRKNCKDIIGKPDLCFKKYKVAVFCDSEFWHGKYFLEGKIPKTNREYWEKKIKRNIERDKKVNETLKNEGWEVLRFWGKDILNHTDEIAEKIISVLEKRKKEI